MWLVGGVSIVLAACKPKTDTGFSINEWVPSGWKLIQSDIGDLDGDGTGDAALVIEQENSTYLKQNDGMGEQVLNLNPRHLIVLLNTPSGYRKVVEATRFLPSEHSAESPCLSDPMEFAGEDSIQIARGVL